MYKYYIRIYVRCKEHILFLLTKRFRDLKNIMKGKKAMRPQLEAHFWGPFIGVTLSLVSLQYISAGISSTITSISQCL